MSAADTGGGRSGEGIRSMVALMTWERPGMDCVCPCARQRAGKEGEWRSPSHCSTALHQQMEARSLVKGGERKLQSSWKLTPSLHPPSPHPLPSLPPCSLYPPFPPSPSPSYPCSPPLPPSLPPHLLELHLPILQEEEVGVGQGSVEPQGRSSVGGKPKDGLT